MLAKLFKLSQLTGSNMQRVFVLGLLAVLLFASSAFALPVQIQKVEINEIEVFQNAANILDLEKGQTLSIRVSTLAQENLDNVEILAFISGYEHNRGTERVSDSVEVLQTQINVTYVRTLHLQLPLELQQDDYKLRIVISDRFGATTEATYNLHLNSERHALLIKDVQVTPNIVRAGSAVLAKVRVDNKGQITEKDIRVQVSIPAINAAAVSYIDEVRAEREEETEEMLLLVPSCTAPGVYDMIINVQYSDGRKQLSATKSFSVTDGSCPKSVVPAGNTSPPQQQSPAPQPQQPERSVLEIILLTLVGLLALLGVVIAVSKFHS